MQQLLARYLLHHHYVVLPGMGTVRLVLSPAELGDDVVNAPQYLFALRADEFLLEQQLQSLSVIIRQSTPHVRSALDLHVAHVKTHAQQSEVSWPGIGIWTHNNGHYSLQPPAAFTHAVHVPATLKPVPASQQNEEEVLADAALVDEKRNAPLWPAWTALAILLLGLLAYFVWNGGRWNNASSRYRSAWVNTSTLP